MIEERGIIRNTLPQPLDEEPWVRLANEQELQHWDDANLLHYNQQNRQQEKAQFFQRSFDFLTGNLVYGDYYEFGCHRGRTFRMALTEARRHGLSEMKFFAFDSFDGLPSPVTDPNVETWKQGSLATSQEQFLRLIDEHGIYVENVRCMKGEYSQSLTDVLQQDFLETERKSALITIDCDLYESAVHVFKFIEPLLQEGSVIYVDDLFAGYRGSPMQGVSRAFLEFQRATQWKFIRHLNVGWWGRSYIAYLGNEMVGIL